MSLGKRIDDLHKRSLKSKQDYYNPMSPDYGLNPVQKQKRHAQAQAQRDREANPPWITEEDKRIPMEEAGCFFYPDKLAIGPMNIDGSPELDEGMLVHAEDIDMSDWSHFTPDNLTLIMSTIKAKQTKEG